MYNITLLLGILQVDIDSSTTINAVASNACSVEIAFLSC